MVDRQIEHNTINVNNYAQKTNSKFYNHALRARGPKIRQKLFNMFDVKKILLTRIATNWLLEFSNLRRTMDRGHRHKRTTRQFGVSALFCSSTIYDNEQCERIVWQNRNVDGTDDWIRWRHDQLRWKMYVWRVQKLNTLHLYCKWYLF